MTEHTKPIHLEGGGGATYFEDGPVDEGDDDGDGILNRDEEIVVIGAEPTRYFDFGYSAFIRGGITASSGELGVYYGIGWGGIDLGTDVSAEGSLPKGWDVDTSGVIYRSGALPVAGYEKVYHDENGRAYMAGEVYDPIADEYVTRSEWKLRSKEYWPGDSSIRSV